MKALESWIWYTDHQYLAQYGDMISNLQEISPMFCNYAVRSCGFWRKGPGQSQRNILSISDLELYVIERSAGVCGRYGGSERWQATVIIENGELKWQMQTTCRFFYGTNWSPAANSGQGGPLG